MELRINHVRINCARPVVIFQTQECFNMFTPKITLLKNKALPCFTCFHCKCWETGFVRPICIFCKDFSYWLLKDKFAFHYHLELCENKNFHIFERLHSVAGLRGSTRDVPSPGPKFFQFHAVFGKIWQNCMLVPPLGSWRPLLREILDPPLTFAMRT